MDQLDISLLVIGGVVVVIGLFSNTVKRTVLSEPILAVGAGIACGPYGLGWIDISRWTSTPHVLEQAARITLAIGLMEVALRLRPESVRVLWRPVVVLLTVGMIGMWVASSAVVGTLLGLSLSGALLLGAIVTPTDPVVASSLLTGQFATDHLPLRVRDLISFESGCNDGLAYVFVMLPVLMMGHAGDVTLREWLIQSVLVGVLGAAAIGGAIGYLAAQLLARSKSRNIIGDTSLRTYTVAFSALTLGAAALLEADALIAVFLAGLVFNLWFARSAEEHEEHIQEPVAKLFTLPMFVIFGLALPFGEWAAMGWPLALAAVLVLLVRRPPIVALAWPALAGRLTGPDVAYAAWFGPIGIAAIYYAAFAWRLVGDPQLWHASSAIVFASIVAHGMTAAPLTRLYAAHARPAPPASRALDVS